MSSSNFSKDTVLHLSVGKLNGSQNKYPNYKSNIIRWFRRLKNLSIKRIIIYFVIIVICYLLYPTTHHNRVQQNKPVKPDVVPSSPSTTLKNASESDNGYEEQRNRDRKFFINMVRKFKKLV